MTMQNVVNPTFKEELPCQREQNQACLSYAECSRKSAKLRASIALRCSQLGFVVGTTMNNAG